MASSQDLLELTRRWLGVPVHELWLDYVALTGNAGLEQVRGYLEGRSALDPRERATLALALNERLFDAYRASLVPLWTEEGAALPAHLTADRPPAMALPARAERPEG